MLKNTLTILALNGGWMSSKEIRAKLDLIVKKTKDDKKPFRETQTKFDKKFYNFISRRNVTFIKNNKVLIESVKSGGATLLKITEHGKRFLLT